MLTRSGGAPTRALLLLTALLAVAGSVLLGLGLAGPQEISRGALAQLSADVPVEVGAEGVSVWSLQADAFGTAMCTAESTPLLRPVEAYSIMVAGTEYHEVARSPRALVAGPYAITCTPEQALLVGPHAERTASSAVRGPVGVLAGAATLALALLLGVVALLAHRRQRRLEAWRVPAHRLDPSLRTPVVDESPPDEERRDVPGTELRPRSSRRRRGRG